MIAAQLLAYYFTELKDDQVKKVRRGVRPGGSPAAWRGNAALGKAPPRHGCFAPREWAPSLSAGDGAARKNRPAAVSLKRGC